MDKVLVMHEYKNKTKYLQSCKDQWRKFVSFVVSAGDLLGKEVKAFLARLAMKLAHK